MKLNVNKPGYTIKILHNILADKIRDTCSAWKIPVPTELVSFLTLHKPHAGLDWEIELLKQAETMDIELLEKRVNALRIGWFVLS